MKTIKTDCLPTDLNNSGRKLLEFIPQSKPQCRPENLTAAGRKALDYPQSLNFVGEKMIFTTISKAKKLAGLSYLGSVNSSSKIEKGKKFNVDTFILYLAPANLSGYEVCPLRTIECTNLCLNTSGRVILDKENKIQSARIKKTRLFFEQREFFLTWLIQEIEAAYKKSLLKGNEFSVRLNGTSDISPLSFKHYGKSILDIFKHIQFYDYTKVPNRFNLLGNFGNYDITFSFSGHNWNHCENVLQSGNNVAAVFLDKVPTTYAGYKVIDGDISDLRYKDEKGVIVGLKYKRTKGNAKPTNSTFVISNHLEQK